MPPLSLPRLPICLLLLLLSGCAITHTLQTEIYIETSPQRVWDTLTDTAGYAAWNPLQKVISGALEEGESMEYRWQAGSRQGSEYRTKITKRTRRAEQQGQKLEQSSGTRWWLTSTHSYIIKPISARTTLLIQKEHLYGFALLFFDPSTRLTDYKTINQSLKTHLESAGAQQKLR